MAQQANIVVFDGASTPVSHTLLPIHNQVIPVEGHVAFWREGLTTVPDESQLNVTMAKRTLKSGVTEKRLRVALPVMESISGQNASGYTAPPKVANVEIVEIRVLSHPRSVAVNRQIVLQVARNLLNNVAVTTPAVTAGPVADLFQGNQMPT